MTSASTIFIAIDPWNVALTIGLPLECHDSINSGALCTRNSGNMFGVEVKDDVVIRVCFSVCWIMILVVGINPPGTVARR